MSQLFQLITQQIIFALDFVPDTYLLTTEYTHTHIHYLMAIKQVN